MSRELHARLTTFALETQDDLLSQAYLNREYSEEIDRLATSVLYSAVESKPRKELAAYILVRPQKRRYHMPADKSTTPLFYMSLAGLAVFVLLILAACQPAYAGPRTLEELIADENSGSVQIDDAQKRRDALESECDCVIEHGVKIHGYPGAWSRRNRLIRDRSIEIYSYDGETTITIPTE